jgi:hypothetical protein
MVSQLNIRLNIRLIMNTACSCREPPAQILAGTVVGVLVWTLRPNNNSACVLICCCLALAAGSSDEPKAKLDVLLKLGVLFVGWYLANIYFNM